MENTTGKKKKFLYDKESEWSYYSKKDLRQKYPKGYRIIGEVSKQKPRIISSYIENGLGAKLHYAKVGQYKKGLYRTKGFVSTHVEGKFIEYKSKNIMGLLMIIVLLVGMSVSAFMLTNNQPMQIATNLKDFDPNIGIKEDFGDNNAIIPKYPNLKMYEDMDEISVTLGNHKYNKCYFQYMILLEDTKEELFATDLIPPGKAVTTVKLSRKFKKGIYPVIIKVRIYNLQDPSIELNGSEYLTKIVAYQKNHY